MIVIMTSWSLQCSSIIWDRAPKDQHRRHSMFNGVLLHQRNPSNEAGRT